MTNDTTTHRHGHNMSPVLAQVVPKAEGGRWYERGTDDVTRQIGRVLRREPPGRLVLAWQMSAQFVYDPDLVTKVEFTLHPTAGGGTRIALAYRDLDRYGPATSQIQATRGGAGGWDQTRARFAALAALAQYRQVATVQRAGKSAVQADRGR